MSYADKLIPIQPSQSTSSYKSKLIPIQSERGKRITQGLPVSSDRRFERTGEATPNFGGEIARSIIKPIARLGQNITGKMDDSGKIDSRQSNYLGTIKPVGNSGDFGKDVLDSIGVGAEIGSNLIGGTGAGAVAKTGLKGLVKQGVTTGARAGIGAGATYGLGAGLQDQKDKNVGQILGNTAIQTVKGGAIGGLAGGVLGGAVAPIVKPSILLPKSSATKAVSKTENELLKIENNYQKLRKNAKFSKDGNAATRKRIAQTGVMTDATDDTGTIITDKIIPKYRALSPINNTEGVVRKNLERLGETVDLDTVENKLLKSVYDSGLQGANLESAVNTVKKEIAGYRLRANPDGRVPLTLMHDAKIDVYNSIDFNTSAEIKAYKKILAKGLKEVVEENSSFNVKEVNETLAPYLKDIEYLESLNGRKVKGGKLGKYSARIAGNIAGGIAGGSVGGLPGSAVGTIVGGGVGDVIQGKILKNTFGRTAETALPESKILKKAVQTGNSPRLQLPAGNKDAPRIRIESGRTINLPKRTQSTADAQSLANLKAQKIAPPSNIPSKVSISKTIPQTSKKVKGEIPSKLPEDTFESIQRMAKEYDEEFTSKVSAIGKSIGLDAKHGGAKSIDGIKRKAPEYGGDPRKIPDLNRSAFLVDSTKDIRATAERVVDEAKKQFGSTARIKYDLSPGRYQKVLVNVETPVGLGEMQITSKKLWNAKKNGGDALYRLSRNKATPKEVAELLTDRGNEIYSFMKKSPFRKAVKASNEGGFTYDVIRNVDFAGTPHIAVSPYPERSIMYKGATSIKHLADFLEKNIDLLQKKGYAMGGWYNKANKTTYLDIVVPVNKKYANLAEELGNKSNQIAGFDLEDFVEIKYKGTGTTDNVVSLEERQALVDKILEGLKDI